MSSSRLCLEKKIMVLLHKSFFFLYVIRVTGRKIYQRFLYFSMSHVLAFRIFCLFVWFTCKKSICLLHIFFLTFSVQSSLNLHLFNSLKSLLLLWLLCEHTNQYSMNNACILHSPAALLLINGNCMWDVDVFQFDSDTSCKIVTMTCADCDIVVHVAVQDGGLAICCAVFHNHISLLQATLCDMGLINLCCYSYLTYDSRASTSTHKNKVWSASFLSVS